MSVTDFLAVAVLTVFVPVGLVLVPRWDAAKIRSILRADEGQVSELKLVSVTEGSPRLFNTRTYRVVLTLPNGGRLLRRAVIRGLGRPVISS